MQIVPRFQSAVNEVFDFVESKHILSQPFQPDLLENLELPIEVVREPHGLDKYQTSAYPEIGCATEWPDVLYSTDHEYSAHYERVLSSHPQIESEEYTTFINAMFLEIRPRVAEQLPDFLARDDVREIQAQIECLVQARAKVGKTSDIIYEKFFQIYRAYGYPCGWIGEFPQGKLVVFSNEKHDSISEKH